MIIARWVRKILKLNREHEIQAINVENIKTILDTTAQIKEMNRKLVEKSVAYKIYQASGFSYKTK